MQNMIDNVPRVGAVLAEDITAGTPEPVSLDDRMVSAYAKSSVSLEGDRNSVMGAINSTPGAFSGPEFLFEVQKLTTNYGLQVSLLSTLTRKGVAAVETLLRA